MGQKVEMNQEEMKDVELEQIEEAIVQLEEKRDEIHDDLRRLTKQKNKESQASMPFDGAKDVITIKIDKCVNELVEEFEEMKKATKEHYEED